MAVNALSAADFRTAEGSDAVTINRCSVVCTAGTSWTSRTVGLSNTRVCWSSELRLFVAVSNDASAAAVVTSPDGVTWTPRTTPAAKGWRDICWAPELRLFVAICTTTATDVMTSPDGSNWTLQTCPTSSGWWRICWSPQQHIFVAVAGSSVMSSPDGVNWTLQTCPLSGGIGCVCWAPEIGLFVALGESAFYMTCMTSPNGVTWTGYTPGAINSSTWQTICWSPELRIFCAVARDSGFVATSKNGSTWTQVATLPTAGSPSYTAITWVPELRIFGLLIVYFGGSGFTASPDGVTWARSPNDPSSNPLGMAWSPELRLFMVSPGYSTTSGSTSTIDKLQISTAPNGAIATAASAVRPAAANQNIQGWLRINVNGTDRFIPYW